MKQLLFLLPILILLASCSTSKPTKDVTEANNQVEMHKDRIDKRDQHFRETGVDFMAFGHEPSWILTINKVAKTMEINLQGKALQRFSLEEKEYIEIRNLQAENSTSSISLIAEEKTCTDHMSGEVLQYKVFVEFDGVKLNGYGKDLRQADGDTQFIPTQLNDIWALEAVDEKKLDFSDSSFFKPMLEINLNDMIAIGTTGCNNFQADIIIEGDSINFPPFMMTQMFCPGYEGIFVNGINKTATYKLQESILLLYDKDGKEVLRFKKERRLIDSH